MHSSSATPSYSHMSLTILNLNGIMQQRSKLVVAGKWQQNERNFKNENIGKLTLWQNKPSNYKLIYNNRPSTNVRFRHSYCFKKHPFK